MMLRYFMVLCFIVALAPSVWAHDFWLNSQQVDPQTKMICCGENDCHLLPVSAAHPTSAGYLLDDTRETVPWARVQPSPDGGIWACRWGGETKCFFAPIPGA